MHVLEIEVSQRSGRGDYLVQVVHSPAGEASAAVAAGWLAERGITDVLG